MTKAPKKSKFSLVTYTIEFRCNSKHEKLATLLARAFGTTIKTAIPDPECQVVVYSRDFFRGTEELARHDATKSV